MIIGFIGTGGIAEAIITGLYRHGGYREPILVSRRSRARSEKLAREFSHLEVVEDNQAIVDRSDWLFISVLPRQVREVVPVLDFRPDQLVISLAAGVSLEALSTLVKPATRICRAVPMPPIEYGLGPTPVFPPTAEVEELFNRVGNAIAVESEEQFSALIASSAVMATFFDWVASNARWLESHQVPARESALYVTSVFRALATMTTKTDAKGLQQMSAQCLTPGGLNEQVLEGARRAGLIDGIQAQVEAAMVRLQGADQGRSVS